MENEEFKGHTKDPLKDVEELQLVQRIIDTYNNSRMAHLEYVEKANRNMEFFLGDGGQWEDDVVTALCEAGVKTVEINRILPTVMSLIGYAINNKMDLVAYPSGISDQSVADVVTKLMKSILKNNNHDFVEQAVMLNGIIRKRGYYDVRMDFSENALGEIKITSLDPLNVIPDITANSYDPDDWQYVLVKRWFTYEELKVLYGAEKADFVKDNSTAMQSDDLAKPITFDTTKSGTDVNVNGRYLVFEIQEKVYEETDCIIYPTGEIKAITANDAADTERIKGYLELGCMLDKRRAKVIKWHQATTTMLLHSSRSPYSHFTVVPYFPLFVSGRTLSPIDNLINPQEVLNKMGSNMLHYVNTVANAGWIIEQDSLTNITTDDMKNYGSKTRVAIEYRKGSAKPERIQPPALPNGYMALFELMNTGIRDISGINEAMNGAPTSDTSGTAIQSRQFFALQNQAIYIESLNYTRMLLGQRILALVSEYYDSHRVFRIAEPDPATGVMKASRYAINVPQYNGNGIFYVNDITADKYDIEVNTQPSQATYENNQFTQALDMLQAGVQIPPHILVKHSALADKAEIIKYLAEAGKDPMKAAVAELKLAQADKARSQAVNSRLEGLYSATTAANLAAMNSSVSPITDRFLGMAGFQSSIPAGGMNMDAGSDNGAPEGMQHEMTEPVPDGTDDMASGMPMPRNNNPLTPPNPMTGVDAGIEGAR